MSRLDRLNRIVVDPAATENEKRVAQRLIQNLHDRGEFEGVEVHLIESWEIAMIQYITARHQTRLSMRGDAQVLTGNGVESCLHDLVRLYPKLESLVVDTVAGFLAAEFSDIPASGAVASTPPSAVAHAAYTASVPVRKLLPG